MRLRWGGEKSGKSWGWERFVNWTQRLNVIRDLEEETDWVFCWKEFVYLAPSPGGNKWSGELSVIFIEQFNGELLNWKMSHFNEGSSAEAPERYALFIEYWLCRQDVGLIYNEGGSPDCIRRSYQGQFPDMEWQEMEEKEVESLRVDKVKL